MSKLDDSRKLKKKLGEEIEILDTLGQDSEEKGAEAVIAYGKEQEKKTEERKLNFVDTLDFVRKRRSEYYMTILAECNFRMREFDPPTGFAWKANISDKGLALYIKDPTGAQYGHGMKITENPLNDARGIDALITKALDYMDILNSKWKTL